MSTRDVDGADESTPAASENVGQAGEASDAADATGGGQANAAGDAGSALEHLRARVADAANDFLKSRLGLERGVDGVTRFPEQSPVHALGQRAEQFARGFLSGLMERQAERAERADGPTPTEVVGRLLSRASDAVSRRFHEYAEAHAEKDASGQVVVDGRFVHRHGGALLAGFVDALSRQFTPPSGETGSEAAHPGEEGEAKVDYRVDLPSVLSSLFVRPDAPKPDQGGEEPR